MLVVEGAAIGFAVTGESMGCDPKRELTPRVRAAKVAWALLDGERLKTRDVARVYQLTMQGARELLGLLSLELPIYRDDNGYWRRLKETDQS